jgi:general secretion pathway protein G
MPSGSTLPGVPGTETPRSEERRAEARRQGRSRFGFTLIEMMIVMSIIVILISLAVPFYQKGITRARETVLHNNLFAMRNAIDEYSYDKQKAPQSLQDLVTDGYLRDVPKDPITGSNNTWKTINEDAGQAVNASEPGIFDVRSGSPLKSLEGTSYSDW